MWNSPGHIESEHRRYCLDEISALVLPLDELMAAIDSRSVAEVVDEEILRRMEEGEFIYTLYEVLRAMLEDIPVPKGGHTGVQMEIRLLR
ncbi:hypothetical protein N9Z18_01460 [Verrucomicrobiales bacterium]|jgi:hypothetical protein|nr:hypothetical protein [Verrucomicrobiales bacterium]